MLNNVGKTRSFEYNEIDVMDPGEEAWKNAYEFDVPVVGTAADFHRHSRAKTTITGTRPAHLSHLF